MNTNFDTQKVRIDLQARKAQAEDSLTKTSDVSAVLELAETIRWLTNKLNFLGSPIYQERKQKALQSHGDALL